MKLKTLKDFIESNYQKEIAAVCVMKDLKQEAIKWVKDKDKMSPSAKVCFKHFFNISEEELSK